VGALLAERASHVRREREAAVVVEAVVRAAERDHAVGMAAAADALWDEVGGVDGCAVAHEAAQEADLGALLR
jgi:hypothetical protein